MIQYSYNQPLYDSITQIPTKLNPIHIPSIASANNSVLYSNPFHLLISSEIHKQENFTVLNFFLYYTLSLSPLDRIGIRVNNLPPQSR